MLAIDANHWVVFQCSSDRQPAASGGMSQYSIRHRHHKPTNAASVLQLLCFRRFVCQQMRQKLLVGLGDFRQNVTEGLHMEDREEHANLTGDAFNFE